MDKLNKEKKEYKGFPFCGPYTRKSDNRTFITLRKPNGKQTTISYPKFLMEQKLGRYLSQDETVDHIDGNVQNNELHNLRVLKHSEHAANDSWRNKAVIFTCPTCGRQFTRIGLLLSRALSDRKRNKAGPFCSKHCAGLYGSAIRCGKQKKLEITNICPIKHKRRDTIA